MNTDERLMIEKNWTGREQPQVLKYFAQPIRHVLEKIEARSFDSLEEVRLRAGKPLMVQNRKGQWLVETGGVLKGEFVKPFIVLQEDMIKTLELMSENSIYAYQDEIKNGFITLRGGYRVGICGRTVMDGTAVKNIKDISGLNIRMAKQVKGCSRQILKYLLNPKGEVFNTLLISPPQCGKTTMIRDVARVLSDGADSGPGLKVGLVDERSEIAACYKGMAQNDIGIRTDVLDGCPKSIGMPMLLRSMSPQVIITDEIGNQGDREAVMQVLNAGVKIITTAHGYNVSELKTRKEVLEMMEEKVFDRYLVLSSAGGPGTLEEVIDGQSMEILYKRGQRTSNRYMERDEGEKCC